MRDEHVTLLGTLVPKLLHNPLACQNFMDGVQNGAWARLFPVTPGVSFTDGVMFVVRRIAAEGWVRVLLEKLVAAFTARSELKALLDADVGGDVEPTDADPSREVLLAGLRPFVNRLSLRGQLADLTEVGKSGLLLVDGEPQTGKTFSYYLIEHVGTRRGFVVHKFEMDQLPEPKQLAELIVSRIGAGAVLPDRGVDSMQIWAEKLASIVANAVKTAWKHPTPPGAPPQTQPRIFVFDEFVSTPLPEGTASLITWLAKFTDGELRGLLRVVLVRFPGKIPSTLEDIALRDDSTPFNRADMVAMIMQTAGARRWPITEPAVKDRIDKFEDEKPRTLRDRFQFLKKLVKELGDAAARARLAAVAANAAAPAPVPAANEPAPAPAADKPAPAVQPPNPGGT